MLIIWMNDWEKSTWKEFKNKILLTQSHILINMSNTIKRPAAEILPSCSSLSLPVSLLLAPRREPSDAVCPDGWWIGQRHSSLGTSLYIVNLMHDDVANYRAAARSNSMSKPVYQSIRSCLFVAWVGTLKQWWDTGEREKVLTSWGSGLWSHTE